MREYGQIQCAFWQSDALRGCTDAGRLLGAYLLTSPHSNGIGCYRLPDGYVMEDLQWSSERVAQGFAELSRNGFADRFDGVVFIPNFLRWNRVANANVAQARMTDFRALPKGRAKNLVAAEILQHCKHLSPDLIRELEQFANASETVPQTIPGTVCQTGEERREEERRGENSYSCSAQSRASNVPRVTTPPSRLRQADDPEWLLEFKRRYPIRAGNPDWRGARRSGNARLQEGHTVEEFLAGAERYAAYIRAVGKERTEYVMQASRFLGPSKPFTLPWDPPASRAQREQDANVEAGLAWLQQSAAGGAG